MLLSYRMLLFKISRLTGRNRMTAVDEIALAGQLAEMMHRPHAAERVVADLMDHEHAVRRVALNAVRARCFACLTCCRPCCAAADAEPWLRHDAAWVVAEASSTAPNSVPRCAHGRPDAVAAGRGARAPDDALLQARVKARTALDALLKKSAAENQPQAGTGRGRRLCQRHGRPQQYGPAGNEPPHGRAAHGQQRAADLPPAATARGRAAHQFGGQDQDLAGLNRTGRPPASAAAPQARAHRRGGQRPVAAARAVGWPSTSQTRAASPAG